MKTIGVLGGMSWESTLHYYRLINQIVSERLGGSHSAKIVLDSIDFHQIEAWQNSGDWEQAGQFLAKRAQLLECAGADFIVLATNTMHKVAPAIETAVSVPFLHLADVTARNIVEAGLTRVALLGTRFTMSQDFYRERIQQHGLEVMIPDNASQDVIHRIIYNELIHGVILDDSRQAYLAVMEGLIAQGAQGIILGCTEIELLVSQEHCPFPVFATTALHAKAAADLALNTYELQGSPRAQYK